MKAPILKLYRDGSNSLEDNNLNCVASPSNLRINHRSSNIDDDFSKVMNEEQSNVVKIEEVYSLEDIFKLPAENTKNNVY